MFEKHSCPSHGRRALAVRDDSLVPEHPLRPEAAHLPHTCQPERDRNRVVRIGRFERPGHCCPEVLQLPFAAPPALEVRVLSFLLGGELEKPSRVAGRYLDDVRLRPQLLGRELTIVLLEQEEAILCHPIIGPCRRGRSGVSKSVGQTVSAASWEKPPAATLMATEEARFFLGELVVAHA